MCEFTVLVLPYVKTEIRLPLAVGDQPGLFVGLVLVIALAWLIGYISREFGFKVLSLTEPTMAAAAAEAHPGVPAQRQPASRRRLSGAVRGWFRGFRCQHQSPVELRERLVQIYGKRNVEKLLETHPAIRRFMRTAQDYPASMLGGNIPDNEAAALFYYCKLLLRRSAPEFGLESIELEINILASAVLPAALLPFVTAVSIGRYRVPWISVVAIISIVILGQVARSYRRLRGAERWEAVRNTMELTLIRQVEHTTDSAGKPEQSKTPTDSYGRQPMADGNG